MCTCITYKNGDFYFGRNLDLEYTFGEQVVITPRNYELKFRKLPSIFHHYAMIGMATVAQNYPLYAEAVNEKGLDCRTEFPWKCLLPKGRYKQKECDSL